MFTVLPLAMTTSCVPSMLVNTVPSGRSLTPVDVKSVGACVTAPGICGPSLMGVYGSNGAVGCAS